MNHAALYIGILAGLTVIYAAAMFEFGRGLRQLRKNRIRSFAEWPSLSVIVPARNEGLVIEQTLRSLFQQDYPGNWEIIVVDDRSTDDTPRILHKLSAEESHLKVLTVIRPFPASPKKHALALGITAAKGEIIVTTDADCFYHPQWLRTMVSYMDNDVGVVAGLTVFDLPGKRAPSWQHIQWLDFVAQQFLAAGAAGAGVPSSCNGSNLAYRRKVYDEISGFGATGAVVSGDDVLFAQRVAKQTTWRIVYATNSASIVSSLPARTLAEMFQQRLRWASKGHAYRRSMSVFLCGLYAYYLLWICSPIIAFQSLPLALSLTAVALGKLLVDYFTLRTGCAIFGRPSLLRYFLPFVALHTLLTPVFGIAGLIVPYRWKGKQYRTAKLPISVKRGMVRARRRARRAAEAATDPLSK
jgi:cellulose synthase/poly-beta-1,6-N-acetylglucosamine synthase-like glycosyltransferase